MIEIPKTVKRYSDGMIEKLMNVGFFDDVYNLKSHLIGTEIEEEFIERPVKNIGVWLSGGADSSLLAYLLCKKVKEENLNVDVMMSTVRRNEKHSHYHSMKVIDFIEKDLDYRVSEHMMHYPDMEDETKFFRETEFEYFNSGLIDVMYSGINCNPPESEVPQNDERDRDISAEKPTKIWWGGGLMMNPFFKLNKREISEVYKQNNLLNTLLPLTRSCHSDSVEPCGECWWCKEREWGFGDR